MNWKQYPKETPPKGENLLITIIPGWGQFKGKRIVTVGTYNYNSMTKKFEIGPDGSTTIAFAELPSPYNGTVDEDGPIKLRKLMKK